MRYTVHTGNWYTVHTGILFIPVTVQNYAGFPSLYIFKKSGIQVDCKKSPEKYRRKNTYTVYTGIKYRFTVGQLNPRYRENTDLCSTEYIDNIEWKPAVVYLITSQYRQVSDVFCKILFYKHR